MRRNGPPASEPSASTLRRLHHSSRLPCPGSPGSVRAYSEPLEHNSQFHRSRSHRTCHRVIADNSLREDECDTSTSRVTGSAESLPHIPVIAPAWPSL